LVLYVLSPPAPALARADDADRAVLALQAKGAKIDRDLKTRDKPVIRVNLSKAAITDNDLALVEPFEWLEALDLSETPITDAGLVHLHGLKRLKQLDLTETNTFAGLTDLRQKLRNDLKIDHPLVGLSGRAKGRPEGERRALALLSRSAAGFGINYRDKDWPVVRIALHGPVLPPLLAALADLPALRSLDLSLCPLADADLSALGRLEHLEDLSLYATGAGDAALAAVKRLKQLRTLNVAYDAVTDMGLANLKGLDHLQTLIVFRTRVTDEGLAHLTGLVKLQELSLSETAVTDKGLAALKGLTGLRLLSLAGTKVTDAGVADFVKALPVVKVRR
jgi:hypothetical protein